MCADTSYKHDSIRRHVEFIQMISLLKYIAEDLSTFYTSVHVSLLFICLFIYTCCYAEDKRQYINSVNAFNFHRNDDRGSQTHFFRLNFYY